MTKFFLLIPLLTLTLGARENPFFPIKGERDSSFLSNVQIKAPRLSQVSLSLPSTARIIKKVTVEYENLDSSIETKSLLLDTRVDWHLPIFFSQSYEELETNAINVKYFEEIAKIKYAQFLIRGKSLKIYTKDSPLRNFSLGKPNRIVIDFKRESNLRTYIKTIKHSVFKKIRIGNHKGYYRVVFELDGSYMYRLENIKNGYLIILS